MDIIITWFIPHGLVVLTNIQYLLRKIVQVSQKHRQ
jgi:hypothetical protein